MGLRETDTWNFNNLTQPLERYNMNLPLLIDSHRMSELSPFLHILNTCFISGISVRNSIIFLDVNEVFPLSVEVFPQSEMWGMLSVPPKAGRNEKAETECDTKIAREALFSVRAGSVSREDRAKAPLEVPSRVVSA